ncbi:MAG: ATP-binding protein [Hyphomicrobiaceae bacterium]
MSGADGTRKSDGTLHASPLMEAARLLADRNLYALVWFGADLIVTARYGGLASFIEVDEPVTTSCLPLIGLETEIAELGGRDGGAIDLPAVQIMTGAGDLPRLNITIFWYTADHHFLMLLTRSVPRSDLESELSRHMRARLMAEAELAASSRALARVNSELERANRDLEDFAAVISHDLKAPLRALRYAAEDASALIGAGSLDVARQRLDEIEARARRMSEMMTALLDYASVGQKAELAEMVDTRSLANEIVTAIPAPRGFTVKIEGRWPRIQTVRAALDLVLRNLLENAFKHHDQSSGIVTLSAHMRQGALEIEVTDDGPGIDPALHRAVLLPFRTISDSGGTGLGLAFVNRTIESVGGRLTIVSDPKMRRGTAFRLAWPTRQGSPS